MHLVDVCAFYTPLGGGVKTYVERKLRAGRDAGHAVTILAPGRKPGVVDLGGGARIVTIPGRLFPLDWRYSYFHDEAALHATLDELKPDFVEASSPWSSASMVARWPGKAPRALVMHADPLATYAYRWLGWAMSRQAIDRRFVRFWDHLRRLDQGFDLVISATQDLTSRLREGGLQRVTTLPMGGEPGLFSPDLRDEALRRRLLERCGLPDNATLLLGVGRLSGEKRWPMVIDAATAAGIDHPLGLVLIGEGRDMARIVQHARSNPHIQFLAPTRDRPALAGIMASADALVHGCESETFCMVAAEARASGLPIIVPDRGGAADQARPGIDRRYSSGDAQSLVAAIGAFLTDDRGALRQMARTASAGVRLMDQHFEELFDTYARLIAAGRRGMAADGQEVRVLSETRELCA